MIRSPAAHVTPYSRLASFVTVVTSPSARDTVLSSPPAVMNAIDPPSGENVDIVAPMVPRTGVASKPSSRRRYSWRLPPEVPTNAMDRPSGAAMMVERVEVNSSRPGGNRNSSRVVGVPLAVPAPVAQARQPSAIATMPAAVAMIHGSNDALERGCDDDAGDSGPDERSSSSRRTSPA